VRLLDSPTPKPPHALARQGAGGGVPLRDALVPLAIGVGLALLLTATPTLRFMGWFLRSLFHETGHVAMAWLGGCPAFPAISLRGEAAAFHQDHRTIVTLLSGAAAVGLAATAWKAERARGPAVALVGLWLVLTLSESARELLFLLGGHLGELAFAAVFLRRAVTGEDVETKGERPLYAGLGWYLVASNVALSAGLLLSDEARALYRTNGSFGLENDYLRAARLGPLGLPGLSIAMILLGLAVVVWALRFRLVRATAPR
jgi:hypothetical protein